MVIILGINIPASNFALAAAFERVPDLRLETERIAGAHRSGKWPAWITAPSREPIEAILRDDPTVRESTFVTKTRKSALYELELIAETTRVTDIVLAEGGTVLAATGTDGRWSFTLRFSSENALGRTYRRIEEADLSPTIRRLRDGAETTVDDCGLTPPQRKALRRAVKRGYFQIPRKVSQMELAEEIGICHQALSERLRRGLGAVVVSKLESDAVVHRSTR